MSIDTENAKDIRQSMAVQVTIGTISDGGYYLLLTNSKLIRVTLSLRSDLSIINPTLPESEIEIEAYCEDDISEEVAKLQDGTPITFRAGYVGSWSDTRRFYTDQEITWDKGILHIHARDQIHKLDSELPSIYLGQKWARTNSSASINRAFTSLYMAFFDIIQGKSNGWDPYISGGKSNGNILRLYSDPYPAISTLSLNSMDGTFTTMPTDGAVNSIIEHKTRREMVAQLMNLCHQDYPVGFFNGRDAFWLTYVDAGLPSITVDKPTSKFTIYEEDCGNIVNSHERDVSEYQFIIRDVLSSGYFRRKQDGVNATAFKQSGIAATYQGFIDLCYFGLFDSTPPDEEVDFTYLWNQYQSEEMVKRSRPYGTSWTDTEAWKRTNKYGMWLLDESLEDNAWNIGGFSFIDLSGSKWTSTHSTSEAPSTRWNNWVANAYIDATAETASLDVTGYYFLATNERTFAINTGKSGQVFKSENVIWNGHIYAASYNNPSQSICILPDYGLKSLANRSKHIGSFTWKGDPRMQPRDVFTFMFIEKQLVNENEDALLTENGDTLWIGGGEERTIENITMTFEKGGFTSEITYRKGIC